MTDFWHKHLGGYTPMRNKKWKNFDEDTGLYQLWLVVVLAWIRAITAMTEDVRVLNRVIGKIVFLWNWPYFLTILFCILLINYLLSFATHIIRKNRTLFSNRSEAWIQPPVVVFWPPFVGRTYQKKESIFCIGSISVTTKWPWVMDDNVLQALVLLWWLVKVNILYDNFVYTQCNCVHACRSFYASFP